MQMVAEAAVGPAQVEEARQASVQELQSYRDSLNQAEAKTRDLEGQLENLKKVKRLSSVDVGYKIYVCCYCSSYNLCQWQCRILNSCGKKYMNREHLSLHDFHIHVDEY